MSTTQAQERETIERLEAKCKRLVWEYGQTVAHASVCIEARVEEALSAAYVAIEELSASLPEAPEHLQQQERADITAVHLLRQALAALEYYREQWRTTDPVIDAIRRGLEQVQGRAGPVGSPAGEQTGPVPARPAPAAENEDAALLDWLEQRHWDADELFELVNNRVTQDGKRHPGGLRDAIRAARKDGK